MPGFSWSDEPFRPTTTAARVDVVLPKRRDAELAEDESEFLDTTRELEASGMLDLVIAKKDWNRKSALLGSDYARVLHLDLTHSLMHRDQPDQPAQTIFDFITR